MNSGARPEGGLPTLFIDRDAWSHVLDAELRAAGIPFVAHRDVFKPDAPDAEWITEVGRQAWVVVTRDQNIAADQTNCARYVPPDCTCSR